MGNNVLTIVYDKAEQKLDTVIAAAVNELGKLGHVVKEVRVMGDSGEAKVALNTVEGILGIDKVETQPAATVADVVANKAPDGTSPVSPVEGAPVDEPPTAPITAPLTIDQKRDALIAQLEALDAEEEAEQPTADPTNSGEDDTASTSTPVTA